MKYLITSLALTVMASASSILAQERDGIFANICFVEENPKMFLFEYKGISTVEILNLEGALVSVSGSITTAVLADTVYQFTADAVQILTQGNLQKWPCLDASDELLRAMDISVSRDQSPLVAEIIKSRTTELEATLADTEKARFSEAEAAKTLRLQLAETKINAQNMLTQKDRELWKALSLNKQSLELRAELDMLQRKLDTSTAQIEALESQRNWALAKVAAEQERCAEPDRLQRELDAWAAKDQAEDQAAKVQIEALGSQLNSALAQVAAEQQRRADLEEAERLRLQAENQDLSRYRSEFFGQISQLLAGQPGVRVVGDRFVFDSEVLFNPGSADLAPEGQAQIKQVVETLTQVVGQIPPQINWLIRVDGHTDNIPLSGAGRFADNWALSQGRALAVVKFMQDTLGFAPERLAAAGFGEYQPVAQGDTPEARAQNRRIELKLTER
jgi:chemotaxis protein MotB